MSDTMSVLVGGATGQQGGAVARLLLDKGHRVIALTRKPESEAAARLREAGAEVALGSFDDRSSLERAMRGVDAVYTMSTSFEAGNEAEIRQGIAVADAARSAGVAHLVFSSVGSADHKTGIPHFESKYEVEQHISGLGIPYTIVRPVAFFENVFNPFVLPGLRQGALAMALPADRSVQQISVRNIASFAVMALENKDSLLGKRIDIASDELTGEQTARILSEVSGRNIEYVQTPLEQVRAMNEDFALNMEWLIRVGYSVDIPGLHREFREIAWETFEAWAKRRDWSILDGSGESSA